MPIGSINATAAAMKGYLLAFIKPTSPAFQDYPKLASPTLQSFGGKILSKQSTDEAIYTEHAKDLGAMVVIQFPSLQKALDWYNSDEYAAAKKLRLETSKGYWAMMEGPDFGDDCTGFLGTFIKVNDLVTFQKYAPVESLSKFTSPNKRSFAKLEDVPLTETRDYDAVVLIAFPTAAKGKEWMESKDYQPQLELRTSSSTGPCAIIGN
mmetsp:Transcript_12560/g.34841  ORF Transcript_12560/g.34841 Transcript_12560/m.34841 type:complete len:208 (-) Transcript_12560:29-652(-)